MSFDILSALNVNLPESQAAPEQLVPQQTKILRPSFEPPQDPTFVPELRKRRNASNLTENEIEQLTTEQKQLLVNELRFKQAEGQKVLESEPEHVHTHVSGCWCPQCYNEYTSAKAKALKAENLDKERLAAKELEDRFLADEKAEKDLEIAKKTKNAAEMQQFLDEKAADKEQFKEQEKEEREAMKTAHLAELERIEKAFLQRKCNKQKENERALEELAEIEKSKRDAEERQRNEDHKSNTYVLPLGRSENEEEKIELEQQMLAAEAAAIQAKQEEKKQKEAEKEAVRALQKEQMKQQLEAQEKAEEAKRDDALKAAREYDEMLLDKAAKAKHARENEIAAEKAAADAIKAQELKEREQQQQREEEEQQRLLKEMAEGQKIKDLNKELDDLLAKVSKIEQEEARKPIIQQECDRCDDLNEPEAMVQLTREEIEDAAKYVPLKVNRRSAASLK